MSGEKPKLTYVANLVQGRVEDKGGLLIYADQKMYHYSKGAWAIVKEDEKDNWYHRIIYESCEDGGVEYGTKVMPLLRTMEAYFTKPGIVMDQSYYIAARNGTINMNTPAGEPPELVEWSPEHYTTRRVNIKYEPGAECPEWHAMLRRMLEDRNRSNQDVEELCTFLQEWVGVNLIGAKAKSRNRGLQRGLFLVGDKKTAKSTFSDVMKALIGPKGTWIAPDLAELGSEFGKSMLLNAQAVIADDAISKDTLVNPKLIKAMITMDAMTVNRKFMPHVTLEFGGPVLFTTNELPQIHDTSDAVYDRLAVVWFHRQFTDKDVKSTLKGYKDGITLLKKKKELPGILNWALEGGLRAIDRGAFFQPSELLNAKALFRARNDPIYSFVLDCLEPSTKHGVPTPVMAAICAEYAAAQHLVTKLPMKQIMATLPRTVASAHPSARAETTGRSKLVQNYCGVQLNALGLAFWEKTREKGHAILDGYKSPHVRLA